MHLNGDLGSARPSLVGSVFPVFPAAALTGLKVNILPTTDSTELLSFQSPFQLHGNISRRSLQRRKESGKLQYR